MTNSEEEKRAMNFVMVVDDSEPDQFLSKYTIEQNSPDAEILQAYDGQEALEILDKLDKQPEVIFLDINMPRMNGHEFLKEYSQRNNCGSVVVMLSSSDQEKDKAASFQYACVKKYLTKPLNEDAVAEVDDLIKQSQ